MSTAIDIEAARRLAIRAHQGHIDASGRSLIDHPFRVAEHASLRHDDLLVVAGLLHDAVEKGGLTWAEVRDAGWELEM